MNEFGNDVGLKRFPAVVPPPGGNVHGMFFGAAFPLTCLIF